MGRGRRYRTELSVAAATVTSRTPLPKLDLLSSADEPTDMLMHAADAAAAVTATLSTTTTSIITGRASCS